MVVKPRETIASYSFDCFVEVTQGEYLLAYYKEQQAGAFHALVQGSMMVEEYEAIFMEIVKYVPHLDSDDRQVE